MDRHQTFGFLLHDVTRLYKRRLERRLSDLALTLQQARTLWLIAKHEGINQKKLADLAEIDPMSIVRIVDRMQADGWVERRPDPADRRASSLRVTPAAAPVLERIQHVAAQMRTEVLQGLSAEERGRLVDLLEHVHGTLCRLPPLDEAAGVAR